MLNFHFHRCLKQLHCTILLPRSQTSSLRSRNLGFYSNKTDVIKTPDDTSCPQSGQKPKSWWTQSHRDERSSLVPPMTSTRQFVTRLDSLYKDAAAVQLQWLHQEEPLGNGLWRCRIIFRTCSLIFKSAHVEFILEGQIKIINHLKGVTTWQWVLVYLYWLTFKIYIFTFN